MNRFLPSILLVLLTAVFSFLISCSKMSENRPEPTFDGTYNTSGNLKGNATITGEDKRLCPCCGGYFLAIDNNKPATEDYFLTYDFPGGYKPSKFPVRVQIEWKKDENACVNDKITITKMTILSN